MRDAKRQTLVQTATETNAPGVAAIGKRRFPCSTTLDVDRRRWDPLDLQKKMSVPCAFLAHGKRPAFIPGPTPPSFW